MVPIEVPLHRKVACKFNALKPKLAYYLRFPLGGIPLFKVRRKKQRTLRCKHSKAHFDELRKVFFYAESCFLMPTKRRRIANDNIESKCLFCGKFKIGKTVHVVKPKVFVSKFIESKIFLTPFDVSFAEVHSNHFCGSSLRGVQAKAPRIGKQIENFFALAIFLQPLAMFALV